MIDPALCPVCLLEGCDRVHGECSPRVRPVDVELVVREQLAEVYLPAGVEIWITGRNRRFGGERAIDLINRGEGDRVLTVVATLVAL